jgi:hypothetical protein
VNLIYVATFIAAVGDPGRFLTSRKLVAYLGLDPKVRQSGDAPAPRTAKTARGIWSSNLDIRQPERQLAEHAEASYRRMVKDQQAGAPARKVGASATPERA